MEIRGLSALVTGGSGFIWGKMTLVDTKVELKY
jgi:hypothetical protein